MHLQILTGGDRLANGVQWFSFVAASVIWGVFVVLVTEVLSVFHWITWMSVLLCWVLFVVVLVIGVVRTSAFTFPRLSVNCPSIYETSVLIVIAVVGVTAFVAPPNTADSMQYHMSRVMHWIQNGSVGHYPSHILRQLFMKPWAEYAIMHLQILTGGDRLANGVQWFSFVGCAVGISLIARYLGGNRKTQGLAALLAVTLPMAILEGSSTQNDLVLSFWLVCFVACILSYKKNPTHLKLWAIGASLGLAVLTKPVGYMYAFPFLVWFIASRRQEIGKCLIIVGLSVIAINGVDYMRTTWLFGWPLGSRGDNYANELLTFGAFISNAVRNMSIHAALPLEAWNTFIERIIVQLHQVLNLSVNDPRTTMQEVVFKVYPINANEDMAGNPIHFVLGLGTFFIFFINKKYRTQKPMVGLVISVLAGISLLSFITTFQTFSSRFHTPGFLLMAAPAAIMLNDFRWKALSGLCAVVVFVTSWYWIGWNQFRPLVGPKSILSTNRLDQYFYNRPDLKGSYLRPAGLKISPRPKTRL